MPVCWEKGRVSRAASGRLLCARGAGAGIAAVYNVPLGGAIFALEVLLGTISLSLVPPALLTALVATSISWLLLPNEPTYQIPSYHVSFGQIAWSVIFGPIAGFVSVAYVRLISWADASERSKTKRLGNLPHHQSGVEEFSE